MKFTKLFVAMKFTKLFVLTPGTVEPKLKP